MSSNKDTFRESVNSAIDRIKNEYQNAANDLNYAINNVKYEMKTPNIRSYRSSIESLKVKY